MFTLLETAAPAMFMGVETVCPLGSNFKLWRCENPECGSLHKLWRCENPGCGSNWTLLAVCTEREAALAALRLFSSSF